MKVKRFIYNLIMDRKRVGCLALLLVLSGASAFVAGNTKNSSLQNCVFPKFLQTSCETSVEICYWSQGRHFSKKDANGQKTKLHEIYSEWRWAINQSHIIISTGLDTEDEGISKVFTCTRQIERNKFLISAVNSEQTSKYSCMKLTERGENVIELKMGNFNANLGQNLCHEEMLTRRSLLIASTFKEVVDCPADLKGGFIIQRVYDIEQQGYCVSSNDTQDGVFESDCMNKEGIFIDFPGTKNCLFGNFLGHFENKHLSCFSQLWQSGDFSYFITKRRYRASYDVRREAQESEFQCIKYKWNSDKNEVILYLYKDPICYQENRGTEPKDGYVLYLRKSTTLYEDLGIMKLKCTFPKEIQGKWIETSQYFGQKSIDITSNKIDISQTGVFVCREIFGGISYRRCLADYSRAWPLPGQVQYFDHEFMMTSRYDNGCRERMTRLALKSWTNNHVIYRLSQSQPIRRTIGATAKKFYKIKTNYFCEYKFYFNLDPFPHWGRNIEKVISRLPLRDNDFSKCPLFKGKCGFNSVWIGRQSCNGSISSSSSGSRLSYQSPCKIPQATYRCLKQENKINHVYDGFSLIQDIKDKRTFCVHHYFDRTQNYDVILRFDSPQCSDIDRTQVATEGGSTLYEKLTLFEACSSEENMLNIKQPNTSGENPATTANTDGVSPSSPTSADLEIGVKMVAKKSSGTTSFSKSVFLLVLTVMLFLS